MSTVTGIPPVVHSLNVSGGAPNSTNVFTDSRAVNYLLNVSNSDWSYNTVDMQAASRNLLLSQSVNKAVAVFYNTQNNITTVNVTGPTVTVSNAAAVQSFAFNMSSTILTSEAYQFKTVPPTATISNQQPFELSLTPNPASQNDVNALNNIRILNQTAQLQPNFSVNYNTSNVSNALGVEAKAYFANGTTAFPPFYSTIPCNLASENNIAMTFSTTNDNLYGYQLQRFQYADPNFTTTGTSTSVVSTFGGSTLQNVNSGNVSGEYVQFSSSNGTAIITSYTQGIANPPGEQSFFTFPRSWTLFGSMDQSSWTVIDRRTDISSTAPVSTYTPNGSQMAFLHFRIVYSKISNINSGFRMGTWQFTRFGGGIVTSNGQATFTAGFNGSPSSFDIVNGGYNDVSINTGLYGNVVSNGRAYSGSVNVAVPGGNYTYPAFLAGAGGLNYSGQLGANISSVLSGTLALTLSNGGASRAFTQSGGFSGIDNATTFFQINNLVNATQLNMTFANTMTVNLTAAQTTINNTNVGNPLPIFNSTVAVSVGQVAEVLPVGQGQTPITLNFNSNNRVTLTNSGGAGPSAQIVYASDGNLVQNTSLSQSNMAAVNPVYNTTVIGGNTFTNPVVPNYNTLNSTNGFNVFYPQGSTQLFSLSGANTMVLSSDPYYCMVGLIQSEASMNFTTLIPSLLTPARLPILYPGPQGDFNASNSSWNNASYLQLDNTYSSNNQTGFGVLGGSMLTTYQNAYANEIRLRLTPTDPVNNVNNVTTVINTSGSFAFSNPGVLNNVTMSYANPSNLLTYNSTYVAAGPVSYEDYPTAYSQRYTLVFPTPAELASGIMRVQSILVDGFNATNSPSPLATSTTRTIQLGRANVVNFCINECASNIPNVANLNVQYTIVINAALSGVLPYDAANSAAQNAIKLSIPVSYTIYNDGTGSGYNYGSAGVPSAAVWISWDGSDLYTHTISLEGRKGVLYGDSWVDLSTQTPNMAVPIPASYNIDLRESYDILSFKNGIAGQTPNYTINFCLYPQSNYNFNNINYEMPLALTSSGLSSTGWNITSANVTTLNGITGFNLSALQTFTTTYASQGVPLGATAQPGQTASSKRIVINNPQLGLAFDMTLETEQLNQSIYFVVSRSALVSASGQGVTKNLLMINGQQALVDNGVYITGATVANQTQVPVTFATLNLNADLYSAQAYNGQSGVAYNSTAAIGTLGFSSGVSTLIPSNITGSIYTTDAVYSRVLRGYRTATYTISRSALGMSAVFGDYSQNVSNIVPYTAGNPTEVTLDMAQNFGIRLMITANSVNNTSTNFTVNKTQVTAVYSPVAGPGARNCTSSNPSGSIQLINMVDNLSASVPWIDTLNLNNFFHPSNMNMVLSYNQPDIIVSVAQPNCTNSSFSGAQAVQNASYTGAQTVSDAALVQNNYLIRQTQTNFQYSPSYVLRNQSKTFYATIAPVDVTINHIVGTGNNSIAPAPRYMYLGSNPGVAQTQPFSLLTWDSGVSLNAPMTLNQLFRVADFKAAGPTGWVSSNFVYKPLLYSLRGAPVTDVTNYTGAWYEYFTNQDLTAFNAPNITCTSAGILGVNGTYNLTFVQVNADQSQVMLSFSSAFLRDKWNNVSATYGWSDPMYVTPATISNLVEYELTFALANNGGSNNFVLKPVINKYLSQTYNSAYLGGAGVTSNGLGFVSPLLPLRTAQTLNMANFPSIVQSLNGSYPYTYVGAGVEYPTPASIASVNVTNSDWINLQTLPAHMDLNWKVTDTNNMTAGTTLYNQLMAVPPGNYSDAKVMNIFAKDQLVITDYAGNLGFRIGPDGHMYAGDMSTYSLIMNNNNNRSWNGAFVPMYNSDVQLNAGQPNAY